MSPAPIIVVEGLDGVGKTRLSRALARRLGAVWLTTPGAAIRAVRASFDASLADSSVARALGYAATVINAGALALRHATAGSPVVIDRYWLSTLVYASAEARPVLAPLEACVARPALTLFAIAPERVRRARLRTRAGGMSAADLDTLVGGRAAALAVRYRRLASAPAAGQFVELDCAGRPGAVLDAAVGLVRRHAGVLVQHEPLAPFTFGFGPSVHPPQPANPARSAGDP